MLCLLLAVSMLMAGNMASYGKTPALKFLDVTLTGSAESIVGALCRSSVVDANRSGMIVSPGRISGSVKIFGTDWKINVEVGKSYEDLPLTLMTSDKSADVLQRAVEGLTEHYGKPKHVKDNDALWISNDCFIHMHPNGDEGWVIIF